MEPLDYFGSYEETVQSIDEYRQRFGQVKALAERANLTFYWRGQSNYTWGCHSSLHRAVSQVEGIDISDTVDRIVEPYEDRIAAEARDWIRPEVGARLPTIDLLARLQHHGLPTRLVDFSRHPLAGLFFACEDDGVDGRVIVAAARRSVPSDVADSFATPWRQGSATRPADWTRFLYALEENEDFLRIVRQQGVFLVGGTPSTQVQRRANGQLLGAKDVRTCTSIPLALLSWRQAEAAVDGHNAPGRRPTVATALTLRVPAGSKQDMRHTLQDQGFSHVRLFPDIEGFARFGSQTSFLR